ncbi:MAG: hypothetical protein HDS36_05650 [Bacteroides sp.]|nr:hypothetical protein [Bacteroides sp.]MBD5273469.1 hypothetical protein [Bacteroides sp.]MBD5274310.1 hypothetical protein [Bacteroides sp.]MDE6256812.1 hypothetical protein [Muribaculaceae bacterium]
MAETLTLTYLNEDDKAYGLAGMAISLAALDAMDFVADISLDADGPMVNFSQQYYHPASPATSVKSNWDNLLHNFYITSAMVISNVMARSLVRMHSPVPKDILDTIYAEIAEEGKDTCSLEDDEIENIYSRTTSYMRRIFNNPRVMPAVDEFARTISRRRTLSGHEILDELKLLQII